MVLAKARGAKRVVLLPVSAPFHCTLMQPAAAVMAEALAAVAISAPSVPVVVNVRAEAVTRQVSNPQEVLAVKLHAGS